MTSFLLGCACFIAGVILYAILAWTLVVQVVVGPELLRWGFSEDPL